MNEDRLYLQSSFFGNSSAVTADGSKIVVSADGLTADSLKNRGAIFTYLKQASGSLEQLAARHTVEHIWSESSVILGPNEWDHFGQDIAMSADGSVLIVLAEGDDRFNCWAAILTWDGSDWEFRQNFSRLCDTDSRISEPGGVDSDLTGDTLAISSPLDSVDGVERQGQVFVLRRQGDSWEEEAILTTEKASPLAHFGHTLALSGDGQTLVIGVRQRDEDPKKESEVQIFNRVGGEWMLKQILKGDHGRQEEFGLSADVSGDGSIVVVGAPWDGEDEGASVYVFEASAGNWDQTAVFRETELIDPIYREKFQPGTENQTSRFTEYLAISDDGSILGASNIWGNLTDQAMDGWIAFFSKPEGTWKLNPFLDCSSRSFASNFGAGLTFTPDGSVMLASAHDRIFVFIRDGDLWGIIDIIESGIEPNF